MSSLYIRKFSNFCLWSYISTENYTSTKILSKLSRQWLSWLKSSYASKKHPPLLSVIGLRTPHLILLHVSHTVHSWNTWFLENLARFRLQLAEKTKADKVIYLQSKFFFTPMPLFHYICTGNLRSFVFIWTTAGVVAKSELNVGFKISSKMCHWPKVPRKTNIP